MNDSEKKVVDGFGKEWKRFSQRTNNTRNLSKDLEQGFRSYFKIFPWNKVTNNSVGFDLGCGSGRWATYMAPKVKKLICVDPSNDALEIAKKNLSNFNNCEFYNEAVESLSIEDNSMDFGYCLGVLHHTLNPQKGIKEATKKLKKNAPFLIYLYYALDDKPLFYKIIFKVSVPIRKIITNLPFFLKIFICDVIALLVYFPLSRFARLLNFLGIETKNFPLSHYANASIYTLRTDSLDRFGTSIEHRFTKDQIREMLENSDLHSIVFSNNAPFWCAIGYKK